MRTTYEDTSALDRPTLPPSRSKQLLRTAIHLLSYHFILTRRRTTVACVAGFRLTVRPTVFHPRYFLSSKFFANFLSGIDLVGKRVADVGTGSGILALAAARAGAASVVALDINPNAAMAAASSRRRYVNCLTLKSRHRWQPGTQAQSKQRVGYGTAPDSVFSGALRGAQFHAGSQ